MAVKDGIPACESYSRPIDCVGRRFSVSFDGADYLMSNVFISLGLRRVSVGVTPRETRRYPVEIPALRRGNLGVTPAVKLAETIAFSSRLLPTQGQHFVAVRDLFANTNLPKMQEELNNRIDLAAV